VTTSSQCSRSVLALLCGLASARGGRGRELPWWPSGATWARGRMPQRQENVTLAVDRLMAKSHSDTQLQVLGLAHVVHVTHRWQDMASCIVSMSQVERAPRRTEDAWRPSTAPRRAYLATALSPSLHSALPLLPQRDVRRRQLHPPRPVGTIRQATTTLPTSRKRLYGPYSASDSAGFGQIEPFRASRAKKAPRHDHPPSPRNRATGPYRGPYNAKGAASPKVDGPKRSQGQGSRGSHSGAQTRSASGGVHLRKASGRR
jgi:hypothetical protein